MKVWLRDSVKVGVKFYKIPQVHQVLFGYILKVTGKKLSFTTSRTHDESEEPIKATQTLQIVLQISCQKGWGAIAKLLPLADSFLLSTNGKPLFFQ